MRDKSSNPKFSCKQKAARERRAASCLKRFLRYWFGCDGKRRPDGVMTGGRFGRFVVATGPVVVVVVVVVPGVVPFTGPRAHVPLFG